MKAFERAQKTFEQVESEIEEIANRDEMIENALNEYAQTINVRRFRTLLDNLGIDTGEGAFTKNGTCWEFVDTEIPVCIQFEVATTNKRVFASDIPALHGIEIDTYKRFDVELVDNRYRAMFESECTKQHHFRVFMSATLTPTEREFLDSIDADDAGDLQYKHRFSLTNWAPIEVTYAPEGNVDDCESVRNARHSIVSNVNQAIELRRHYMLDVDLLKADYESMIQRADAPEKQPRYEYSGRTRADVLAQVLRDIQ